jgi:hypothetical protein
VRVLRLNLGDHEADFHRYISVVHVKDETLRNQLIAALRGIPAGHVDGVTGLVEAHGVMLDLTADNLALLDIPNDDTAALDPVVTPEELPAGGLDPNVVARRDAEHRHRELAEGLPELEASAERTAAALVASRAALADGEANGFATSGAESDTTAALAEQRAEVERLGAARAEAEAAQTAATDAHTAAMTAWEAAVERVAAATDARNEAATAATAAAAALEELDVPEPAELGVETAPVGAIATPSSGAEDEVAALRGRRRELEAALLAVETVDPLPVRAALRNAQRNDGPEYVESSEAVRLADEWARINLALGDDAPHEDDASQFAVVDARVRVENARAALADAERGARLPDIDRADIDELEDAHEKVLDAYDKVERRIGRARAQSRLDGARADEQTILDRMGFLTYADFRMGTSILNIDSATETKLELARVELADAEDTLAKAEAAVTEELARAELLSQRSQVRAAALMLLGGEPADDLESALRGHKVEKRDDGERIMVLREALQATGLDLGNDDLSDDLLFDFAAIWLDEQEETISSRLDIEQQIADIDREMDAADQEPRTPVADEIEPETEAAPPAEAEADAEAHPEVEERRAAVIAAAATETSAATELGDAEAELFATEEAEREAAAAVTAATDAATAAHTAERAASEALESRSEELATTAAVQGRFALEAAVASAERAAAEADGALETGRTELGEVVAMLADLEQGATVSSPAHAADESSDSMEEIEWYLLARIAAQRSVSYAGSLPLVLDDALLGLTREELDHILGRLERMISAVQIVIVTTEADATSWATAAGPERAMAVDLK